MDRKIVSTETIVSDMNEKQLSRWLALFEAVNIIADKADDVGTSINRVPLKKSALDKYIKHTSDIIYGGLSKKDRKS